MSMRRLIIMDVCKKTGLLNYPRCEHTDLPITAIASVRGRGRNAIGRIVSALTIDGKSSGKAWDYLTESESRQCRIAHAIRIADNRTMNGRMVSHTAHNLRAFLRARIQNICGIMMMHSVSDGWWLRASSVWFWSEYGALIRIVEKAMMTPEGETESPNYTE